MSFPCSLRAAALRGSFRRVVQRSTVPCVHTPRRRTRLPQTSHAVPGGDAESEPSTSGEQDPTALLERRVQQLRTLGAFRALLRRSSSADAAGDSAVLLEGALLIARHAHPDLDEAAVHSALDDIARRVGELLPPDQRYPLRIVRTIQQVMYTELGFRGNAEDYYDPGNSCINRVLERRMGIPISLSLVWMEVARRVGGVRLRGLNLPGRFMLQPLRPPTAAAAGVRRAAGGEDGDDVAPLQVLVDPFSGELVLPEEAEELLADTMGARVRIEPQLLQDPQPLSPLTFLLRMLGNLRSLYLSTLQVDSALTIVRYMRAAVEGAEEAETDSARRGNARRAKPAAPPLLGILRDEGLCFFALRRYPECIDTLQEYLQSAGDLPPEERQMIEQVAVEARRRMSVESGGGSGT